MRNEITIPAAAAAFEPPAPLSDEQAAQVAGGLPAIGVIGSTGGRGGYCCLTCASYGRPLFGAVAATFTD